MSDEDADNEFRRSILAMVQILTFGLAASLLAIVYYSNDFYQQETKVEKTKYELKAEVQTSLALAKTLQAQTEMMPMSGAIIPMFVVYGRDTEDRKVWCATFVDKDEAQAWVQASKTFGRAVKGAVIAQQETAEKPTEIEKPN
jgi:ABC-type Fe3+ transport system permease subunit